MRINVKGPIINDSEQWIYDWFGISATSPSKVSNQIDKALLNNTTELTVVINSGGGSVFSASEIYTALKSFKGNVKVEIVGMAASAASVIAMAGSRIEMSPTAQLMIHNASTSAYGDYRDMDQTSDFLQNVNKSIMNAYTAKTGKDEASLKEMMDAETWMTSQQALEHGFIDAVMFQGEKGAAANVESPHLVNGVLPPEVIDKVRNELLRDKSLSAFNHAGQPQLSSSTKNTNQSIGVGNKMNLETLQNEHPELFNEVKNIGFVEGQDAENARIKEIEELAMPGNESLVTAAKFENRSTAAELAVAIVKAEKEKGSTYIKNRNEDANVLNSVPAGNEDLTNTNEDAAIVASLTNIWNGGNQ